MVDSEIAEPIATEEGGRRAMVKKTNSGQLLSSYLTELSEADQQFLAGKRDRGADLESAIRIFLEFLKGFEFFSDVDRPCVTVFGSARFKPGHLYYEMARTLGSELAKAGYPVMTGGGPPASWRQLTGVRRRRAG